MLICEKHNEKPAVLVIRVERELQLCKMSVFTNTKRAQIQWYLILQRKFENVYINLYHIDLHKERKASMYDITEKTFKVCIIWWYWGH